MNKLLLVALLVVSFLPSSSYSATEQSAQVPLPNAIHIDSVSINAGVDTNESKLSEDDKKRLIYEIGESVRDKIIKWVNHQTVILGIAVAIGIFASVYIAIGLFVRRMVEKQLEKIDSARIEALVAIDRSKEALTESNDLHNTLNDELSKRTSEIEKLQENINAFKINLESAYDDLRVDVKDDINFLTVGDKVQTDWLKAIDATKVGANKVIDSLIVDFKSTDDITRVSAVEQLSYFDDEDGKIVTAFEEILKTESQTQFGAIILSKIGNLDKGNKSFDILSNLSDNLDSPNIAPVIGAIGNLQEKRKGDPAFIGKIVDKLIEILENLNLNTPLPGSVEAEETANKKNAVALALTYSGSMGEKAIPLLISMVDDSDNEYRKSAAIALGKIGGKAVRAIPFLERLSKDPLPQVSSVAEEAIRNIQRKTAI